ncbi:class I SAM-dependent methyltransferase [Halococcoides cellulosivorans]|uniref:SAM-dependent methyltransferase n=1 Tax=Halococcoides cellulosivorans TaxID=1679096 RepID=A0A2R4X1V9_9EURY|nr:methyltransferase domain-containing protein [Halococcoides cellulosivorans]AWB27792.1 SAM-dependent methyltransferase [Halococcoides cellulosivorans]
MADTDWDPDAYDDHSFVHEYGRSVVELLGPTAGEEILDLGCGTGELTAEIDETATAHGIDADPSIIAAARERHDASFEVADATQWTPDRSYDAVFSNAAIHWIDDQDAVLETVADALGENGRFVAEFGGAGNVSAINGALVDALAARGYDVTLPWYFPTIGEYATRLEAHGFEVGLARHFDRPTPLEGGEEGLRNLYAMFCEDLLGDLDEETRAAVVGDAEDALREECFEDGTWIADYRRLRVLAVLV